APERRPSGNGQLRTIIEGKAWPRPSGLGIGVGGPYSRAHPRRPCMRNHKARLIDMDGERIDVAVLFGAGLAGTLPALDDAGLAAALATARNSWICANCGGKPKRSKSTAASRQ